VDIGKDQQFHRHLDEGEERHHVALAARTWESSWAVRARRPRTKKLLSAATMALSRSHQPRERGGSTAGESPCNTCRHHRERHLPRANSITPCVQRLSAPQRAVPLPSEKPSATSRSL
jgi:hypothetical protein